MEQYDRKNGRTNNLWFSSSTSFILSLNYIVLIWASKQKYSSQNNIPEILIFDSPSMTNAMDKRHADVSRNLI